MSNGRIIYSDQVPGDFGNFKWPVRFDKCDKYIGINQYNEDGMKDRVLLSPKQVAELIAFVGKKRAAKR